MNNKPLQPSEVSYIIQDQITGRLPVTTFNVSDLSSDPVILIDNTSTNPTPVKEGQISIDLNTKDISRYDGNEWVSV